VKIFLVAVCALILIVFGTWFVFSENTLQTIIKDSLAEHNIDSELHGLKKGLFYVLSVDTVVLKRNNAELILLRNVILRIHPLSLFRFSLNGVIESEVYGGTLSGSVKFTKNAKHLALTMNKVRIGEAVFLKHLGLTGQGLLSGKVVIDDATGHVDFATEDARFEPATYSGRRVPLNIFHAITGALDIKGGTIHLVSVSFTGKEVFARLKGVIQNSVMDLSMEIMPERSVVENPFLLAELEQYKVSPGYFVIPIKGTLDL
jgi:type II secretion system protein N